MSYDLKNIGIDVSRETIKRLTCFLDLTLKWTKKINLIASSTHQTAWERHIVDSAQIFQYAPPFGKWTDIGSGGGFPGIVTAIIAAEHNTDARFSLIESDLRKCTFLRTAIREMHLNATVIPSRIETAPPQDADVVSARALADVAHLLPFANRHLRSDGTAVFMKGRSHAEEISAAKANWRFDLRSYPSITDPTSRIILLKDIISAAP